MINVGLDEKAQHAAKGAAHENARQEEPGRHCGSVRDDRHEVPDEEVEQQWVVLVVGFLVQEGLDCASLRVEQ